MHRRRAEGLAKLKPVVKADGTVTVGNASGINDGAAALLIASDNAVNKFKLKPRPKLLRQRWWVLNPKSWALVQRLPIKTVSSNRSKP